jgi:hypothetical protein
VAGWNVAVTVRARVIDTVQLAPDTEEQPIQLLKIESVPGVAVSVTVVPFATAALQPSVEPVVQAMSPPAIVPAPVPAVTAVRR